MYRVSLLAIALFAAVCLGPSLPAARGAITATGNVSPAGPASWRLSTTGYIGNTADGTLTVDSSSDLLSGPCNIGYTSGASGLITVNGAGSTWTSNDYVQVGSSGRGTLNITDGAFVYVYAGTFVGYNSGSTGIATVDGIGSNWRCNNSLIVGGSGSGTLNITGGGTVAVNSGSGPGSCLIGGSTSSVTVDGMGSALKISSYDLCVARDGRPSGGTLNIRGGGTVTVAGVTQTINNTGVAGLINFGPGGGTLTTKALCASPTQLLGTGTIVTQGILGNFDLVFDSTHGSNDTFTLNSQPNQHVDVNLDMSNPSTAGSLCMGYRGNGSLTIRDGVTVYSGSGSLGKYSGDAGAATVAGNGSTWVNSGDIYLGEGGTGTLNVADGGAVSASGTLSVGKSGNGTLNITRGGKVAGNYGYIGYNGYSSPSTGVVTVDGSGSRWGNSSGLYVGSIYGSGTLNMTHGGKVTAPYVAIQGHTSNLTIDDQSLLEIRTGGTSASWGSGTISNNGTVRMLIGAATGAGATYTPISAGTWSGSGTYQPIGGTWDSSNHRFITSSVTAGTSGSPVALDLASTQRVLVHDDGAGGTNLSAGASFLAAPSTQNITFTATPIISGATLSALKSQLTSDDLDLIAWMFAAPDYAVDSIHPIYFSIETGACKPDRLNLWHYDGAAWSKCDPSDLTYDGQYASFVGTSLGGYAVTGVPEPGTLALLVAAGFTLLAYSRRKRMRDVG